MDAATIELRLFAAAEASAKRQGMRLGHGADTDIRRYAKQAADQIAALSATDQQLKLAEGERAFVRLVEGMVEAAVEIPGYRESYPDIIGEQTLAAAMAKLCPLWPIC